MTKQVRIENADTSTFGVLVQVWDKGYPEGQPDVLVREHKLGHPTTMMTDYITDSRYMLVKEMALPPVQPTPMKPIEVTDAGAVVEQSAPLGEAGTMTFSETTTVPDVQPTTEN